MRFPRIPANSYGGVTRSAVKFAADNNPLHVQDYGSDYNTAEVSGIIGGDPPKLSTGRYGNLVAQVDTDGNDLGGIRNVFVAVPIGTYTGWNLFNKNYFEDGFCTLSGSFIPFAPTKQERLAIGRCASLDRRTVSDQGDLCCGFQEGGKRPRRPTLSTG